MRLRVALFLLLLSISHEVHAQPVTLRPERISFETNIEAAVQSAQSHANSIVVGNGTTMALRYGSREPMELFILPLNRSEKFDPRSALHVQLPGGSYDIDIPLVRSSDWHPWKQKYVLHFLSNDPQGADIHTIHFEETSPLNNLRGGLTQLTTPEVYGPSIYHRLSGPKLFGVSVYAGLGGVLLLLSVLLLWSGKPHTVVLLCFGFLLCTNLFSSLTSAHYARAHTKQWSENQTYGAVGSLYTIADVLKREHAKGVILCSDGTSYGATLLQYALGWEQLSSSKPSHVLVRGALDWSYEGTRLRCRNETWNAQELHHYPDGSTLFSILND